MSELGAVHKSRIEGEGSPQKITGCVILPDGQYLGHMSIDHMIVFNEYYSCYKLLSSYFAFNNSSETSKSDNFLQNVKIHHILSQNIEIRHFLAHKSR